MKNLIFFLLLTPFKFVQAQESPDFPDMRSWMFSAGDTSGRYIFADTAFIRAAPSTQGKPLDTLFAGDDVMITGATSKKLTIHGICGPWLKIDYKKNDIAKSGYIWQGLLSFKPLRRGDTKFVYGIEGRADSIIDRGKNSDTIKRFVVGIKVVQDGKIAAATTLLTWDDESANFAFGKIMSGMGLTNVQNILVVEFSGEACGIPTIDYYLAWTKNKHLARLPDKTNISDADVYYHIENFTFPNEKNGAPDVVCWNMTMEEATDKVDKDGNSVLKTTAKKRIVYNWSPADETFTSSSGQTRPPGQTPTL